MSQSLMKQPAKDCHVWFGGGEIDDQMAENLSVAPIERCGHLPQEEQPEAVNRLLLDFLRGWAG